MDCSDGSGCTTDTCRSGVCERSTIAACLPCADAVACDDEDPCTIDVCAGEGVCEHADMPECVGCRSARDCDDGDPCTRDACGPDGSCRISAIPGCVSCDRTDDCADGNVCTLDACTGGVCTHERSRECSQCVPGVEICGDFVDNDCDGISDCHDPNCSAAPVCGLLACDVEVCGDCRDNDLDGLVDYEDPDCCGEMLRLDVESMKLKTSGRVRRKRLRLRTVYSPFTWADFDPMIEDTTIQMSDELGSLLCTTVEAHHWVPRKRAHVAFRDPKREFAQGLSHGRFSVRRDGTIKFRTRGPVPYLRTPQGEEIQITVRVGDRCSTMRGEVRPRRKGVRYP
jgi:hypothetical protein